MGLLDEILFAVQSKIPSIIHDLDLGFSYRIKERMPDGKTAYIAAECFVERTPNKVVIKIGSNQRECGYIEREAEVLNFLRYGAGAKVLSPLATFRGDGLNCLVLPFIEGRSAAELLKEQPMPADLVGRVINQVAQTLEIAHRHGVYHADIKPTNILLSGESERPRVHLLDWGIANGGRFKTLAAQGNLLGSFVYMPLEVFRGAPNDASSDTYSCALSAFEMMSGVMPYSGSMNAVYDVKKNNLPPQGWEKFAAQQNRKVVQVIWQALRPKDERTPTPRLFARELLKAIG